MSSVDLLADGEGGIDGTPSETLFWWCKPCGGAVNWRSSTCFCCGASKPADAERLTRSDVEHRARNREQLEEELL